MPKPAQPTGLEPSFEQLEQFALLEADVVVQELAEGTRALDGVEAPGSGAELLVLLPDAVR